MTLQCKTLAVSLQPNTEKLHPLPQHGFSRAEQGVMFPLNPPNPWMGEAALQFHRRLVLEGLTFLSCLTKAGGAPIPPETGISRLSRELTLDPHSGATRQWELVPHFHWEVISGANVELNFNLIHLLQGSVTQCSILLRWYW